MVQRLLRKEIDRFWGAVDTSRNAFYCSIKKPMTTDNRKRGGGIGGNIGCKKMQEPNEEKIGVWLGNDERKCRNLL